MPHEIDWREERHTEWRLDQAQAAAAEDAAAELADAGAEVFEAAELLAVVTDRRASDWHDERLDDIVRVRDTLRQALVVTLLLVGPGDCTVAKRMAKRATGPGFQFVRGELRAGRPIAADLLDHIWEELSRDA